MKSFKYRLRPEFNTTNLLIEFISINDSESLIKEVVAKLKTNGFHIEGIMNIWENDEIWIELNSENGRITITKDIYDLVFILGDNNQRDILTIDQLLSNSDNFYKVD